MAEYAFRAVGYTGTDGALIWKAACWVNTGAITQAQFGDACQGVNLSEPAKRVGYFRAILKDTLGEARLTELERRTTLPRGFVPGPLRTDEPERHRRREEWESAREPENLSGVIERAMKRLPQMSADELAELKGDFKRRLDEASKKGKAGAA